VKGGLEIGTGGKNNGKDLTTSAICWRDAAIVVDVKYHKHRRKGKKRGGERKARGKQRRAMGCVHARTRAKETDDNHNDIPPKLSPVFSTSLSSPSLLALGKGRKIGLASNPTLARIVGLDIPGEPIMGLENAKFG